MRQPHRPLQAGAAVDEDSIARIVKGLCSRALPKREWTHAAHLTAAAALIDAVGLAGAEAKMPDLIRAYNEATGVANTDDEGYHHTVTLFFLKRVDAFLAPFADEPAPARVARLLASPLATLDYPLAYYSHEVLFSVRARRAWVAPDIKPIDG